MRVEAERYIHKPRMPRASSSTRKGEKYGTDFAQKLQKKPTLLHFDFKLLASRTARKYISVVVSQP